MWRRGEKRTRKSNVHVKIFSRKSEIRPKYAGFRSKFANKQNCVSIGCHALVLKSDFPSLE